MKHFSVPRLLIASAIVAALLGWISTDAWSQQKGKTLAKSETPVTQPAQERVALHPAALLVRDPAVRAQLRLETAQVGALDEFCAAANEPLWCLRDAAGFAEGVVEIKKFNAAVEEKLKVILTAAQQERLGQIVLQLQGAVALVQPDVAAQLALTDAQRQKLAKLYAETQALIKEARTSSGSRKSQAELNRKTDKLRGDLQKSLLAALTPAQRARWAAMQGKPFDAGKLGPMHATAPELRDVEAWINSEPLTLEKLRGQVVAVHFWTFGCINCIHNYTWYKEWQEKFSRRGVTIIGIHTPESEGEKVVESIRKKAQENGLVFPIAVDGARKNWQAWGNNMWPSVYLIDKKGFVRHWWYGELNWEGGDGEKYMRDRIEELLAEK